MPRASCSRVRPTIVDTLTRSTPERPSRHRARIATLLAPDRVSTDVVDNRSDAMVGGRVSTRAGSRTSSAAPRPCAASSSAVRYDPGPPDRSWKATKGRRVPARPVPGTSRTRACQVVGETGISGCEAPNGPSAGARFTDPDRMPVAGPGPPVSSATTVTVTALGPAERSTDVGEIVRPVTTGSPLSVGTQSFSGTGRGAPTAGPGPSALSPAPSTAASRTAGTALHDGMTGRRSRRPGGSAPDVPTMTS